MFRYSKSFFCCLISKVIKILITTGGFAFVMVIHSVFIMGWEYHVHIVFFFVVFMIALW